MTDEAAKGSNAGGAITGLTTQLDKEKQISSEALAKVELLNQQIAALRRQIATLNGLLSDAETRTKADQAQIVDLGRRLNSALAQRVQELSRYRSEFFGRLRKILSQRSDILVVGDRFVFQSEVLFSKGSADLNPAGEQEMAKLAAALEEPRGRDSDRHCLGVAGRRTYRCRSDPVIGLQVELGIVGGARHCRREVSDCAGRLAAPSGCRRIRRVPADRNRRKRRLERRAIAASN